MRAFPVVEWWTAELAKPLLPHRHLVSRSIAQGRRAGLISLAGAFLGFLVCLFAVSAGIATVFALVPEIYLAIKLAGAGYPLWLAWKAVRSGGRSTVATQELTQDGTRKLFLMGFLTYLLNPKVAILYISLLPQFVDPERGHVGLQGLLLGLTQMAWAEPNASWQGSGTPRVSREPAGSTSSFSRAARRSSPTREWGHSSSAAAMRSRSARNTARRCAGIASTMRCSMA
ncbi:lysine transporter LysE [Streptomyces lydicus]|uniref:Lysine transporter LysE n=1 Tax=Streptomyces lydicus TaxID=47763 RepID=A0A3S9YPG5_9ACTN|nr:lysine transporter LysE [Streptomyces lydicus]